MTLTGLSSVCQLSDKDLLSEVGRLARNEHRATAHLIAALTELDARRLYLGESCSSLFTYCTQVLHLSEHAAYGRIEAARAARRFPVILELLADGSVNLTTICLLGPHLTVENHREVLDAARHKSKRDVEHLVAHLRPQPDAPAAVRKLPAPTARQHASAPEELETTVSFLAPESAAPVPLPAPRPAVVTPIAPERYKVQFTVSRETHDKLRRAQDLLRHVIPNGDPAAIFDRALTVLLEDLARTKLADVSRPRTGHPPANASRHIPASVKRQVWTRDEGRCAFVGTHGRCTETGFLEFHHVVPYAEGGRAAGENIELRCRAHNAYEAKQYFGPPFVREIRPWFDRRGTRSGPDRVLRRAPWRVDQRCRWICRVMYDAAGLPTRPMLFAAFHEIHWS